MNTWEILLIEQLQKQLSWQHEKISQIEKSLWTWWIVMQVKSELWTEYQKIIESANWWISNSLESFWILFWVFWSILWVYITILFSKISDKEKEIKTIDKNINDKNNDILEIEKRLIEKEKNLTEIQNKIDSQDDRIYNLVSLKLINERFDRLETNPEDWSHLKSIIMASNTDIVRIRWEKNYKILLDLYWKYVEITAVLYQFFPDYLFRDWKIWLWINWISNWKVWNYRSEINDWTSKIFELFVQHKNEHYEKYLIEYLKFIYNKLLVENMFTFSSYQIDKLNSFINNKVIEAWEQQLREEIKNPLNIHIA